MNHVYAAEIEDSLEEMMKDNCVAFLCEIVEAGETTEADIAIAAINAPVLQEDLYGLQSILVSAGWNKNDDVFSALDLWNSRNTPVDKPLNYMHDGTDIIGHMTKSAAMDEAGNILSDDTAECDVPEKLDLVTHAVIYKTWIDKDQRKRVLSFIADIDANKYSVSMECVFRDFDYAIIGPDGAQSVVARDEGSAFLTKYLRAYGGSGKYQGHKIGRMLRSLYFTGKGLVDKPANIRSVILQKGSDTFSPQFTLTAMELKMPEDNELETAKASVVSLSADLEASASELKTLEQKISDLEVTIATLGSEKITLFEELAAIALATKVASRKAALKNAGASEDKISDIMAQFADASEEMFSVVVALVPDPVVEVEVKVEVEAVAEEAEASDLDSVEVEEEAVSVADETIDKIAIASAHFRSTFETTKKLKQGV